MTVVGSHDGDTPVVAVLSDASDFHREPGSSIMTELLSWASLICKHSGISTTALLLSAVDTDSLIAGVRRAATNLGAVYLAHINPARADAARVALADTVTVITDRQAQAVALVAATLRVLVGEGVALSAGRMVIVGGDRNPMVATLAVAAGIGEIDSWGRDDAHNFPLRTLNRRVAVIDLLGCVGPEPGDGAGSVRGHDEPARVISVDRMMTAVAASQLLAAAGTAGAALSVAEFLACAQLLAQIDHVDLTAPARPDAASLRIPSVSDFPPGTSSALSGGVVEGVFAGVTDVGPDDE